MKANEDKHLEKFIDQLMKDQTLEKPSLDFTSKIMANVLATQTPSRIVYKPLISKEVFIAILSAFAILIAYLLYHNTTEVASKRLMPLDFNFMETYNLSERFRFSKMTTYTVALTTLMLFIQIPILKNYFDRRQQ